MPPGLQAGQAYVELVPQLDPGFAAKAAAGVDAATAPLLGRIEQRFSKIGDSLTSFGKKLSTFVTLPLIAAGVVAFKFASDYEESLNKVRVVFGPASDAIEAFAKNAAKNLGLSRQEALEAAGTFGNLFVAMGLGQVAAAGLSGKIITLASDLASFNNANPKDVLEALRAGLVGEVEPLRRFGINLSQARIEARALELGLWDGNDAISASAKAQAAYSLIVDDTTTAQGDFARTADGAANKQRILTARMKDAAAQIGEKLLPIGQKLLDWVSALLDGFSTLSPETQDLGLAAAAAAIAAGPLSIVLGGIAKTVSAGLKVDAFIGGLLRIGTAADGSRSLIRGLITGIGDLASKVATKIAIKIGVTAAVEEGAGSAAGGAAGGGIGAWLAKLVKKWGMTLISGLSAGVMSVGFIATAAITLVVGSILFEIANKVSPQDAKVIDWLPSTHEWTKKIGDAAQKAWDKSWKAYWDRRPPLSAAPIWDWISRSVTTWTVPDFTGWAETIGQGIEDIAGGIWEAAQEAWDTFWNRNGFSWGDVWDSVMSFLSTDGSDGGAKGKGGASTGTAAAINPSFLDDIFEPVFSWFGDLPEKILNAIPDPFSWLFTKAMEIGSGFLSGLESEWPPISAWFSSLPGRVGGLVAGIGQTVWGWMAQGWEFAVSNIGNVVERVVGFFAGLPGRISQFAGSVASAAVGIGRAVIDGITSGLSAVGGFAADIGSAVYNAFRNAANRVIGAMNNAIPNSIGSGPFSIDLPDNPIPTLHTGGVIPGRPGTETYARVLAGEGVFTQDQMTALGRLIMRPAGVSGGEPRIVEYRPTFIYQAKPTEADVRDTEKAALRGLEAAMRAEG